MEVINRASKAGQERLSEIQKIEAEFIKGAFWETVKCWVSLIVIFSIAFICVTVMEIKTREGHASYEACVENKKEDQYCEMVVKYRPTDKPKYRTELKRGKEWN